jgi:hypothetical protein
MRVRGASLVLLALCRASVFLLVVALVVIGAPVRGAGLRACTWHQVHVPQARSGLRDADLLSDGRILAVGESPLEGPGNALSMLWDGDTWRRVPMPVEGEVAGVAALTKGRAIAVGPGWNFGHAMSLTFDGEVWHRRATPTLGSGTVLQAVTPVSGTDRAWAVGAWDPGPHRGSQPLVMRWDRGGWTIALRKLPRARVLLRDVVTIDGVTWAVGSARWGSAHERTLALRHVPGHGWHIVPTPHPARFQALSAIGGTARDNLFAVGTRSIGPDDYRGYMLHWNGRRWRPVDPTRLPALRRTATLVDVAAGPDGDLWVLGRRHRAVPPDESPEYRYHLPLVLHRTGPGRWMTELLPEVPRAHPEALVAESRERIWAIGAEQFEDGAHPMVFRRC